MKKAVFIYNPNSGKRTKKKVIDVTDFKKIERIFNKYDYEVEIIATKYSKHAKEIVENLESVDLVVSLGGDGTYSEVVTGNMNRKDKLLVTHVPYGTTNDIGSMFGLGKNIYKNLELLLTGEVKNIDLTFINDKPFVYVAGFGKFLNIPYETDRNLKKKLGYFAYLYNGIKDFFIKKTSMYELEYEVNGEKYHGLYSLVIVSNATRIAGISGFYKDVKLDDGKFEVLFCNLKTKQDVVKSLLYLSTNDITKVPGFYFHKTDHLKIKFITQLKKPWCIDGEKFDEVPLTYDIRVNTELKMLVPKKTKDNLFTSEDNDETE